MLTLGYSRKCIRLLTWRSSARIWADALSRHLRAVLGGDTRDAIALREATEGRAPQRIEIGEGQDPLMERSDASALRADQRRRENQLIFTTPRGKRFVLDEFSWLASESACLFFAGFHKHAVVGAPREKQGLNHKPTYCRTSSLCTRSDALRLFL